MKDWLFKNRLRTTGVILILSSLLINPFLLTQLFSPDKHLEPSTVKDIVVFEIFIFSLGLILYRYYLEVSRLLEKIKYYFMLFGAKDRWWPVVIQAVLLALYLLTKKGALSYQLHTGVGDEPSYFLFNFSSLQEILGNHRTFGLPLILKLYKFVFGDFQFWPHFQMLFFILSIFFLYWAFLRAGFDRILSLVVASFLFWDSAIYEWFPYIMTEPLTVGFLHFTIGTLLVAVRQGNRKLYLAMGFSTFILYQLRPNLAYVAALVPLWAMGISMTLDGFNSARINRIVLRFSVITLLPLLLFCLLRLIVVGQFGVVSMMGSGLSGHTVHYLDENNIKYLSGDSRTIAEEILKRKRKLSFPANLSPFSKSPVPTQSKFETEAECFGANLMTAWLVAIKHQTGLEPFSDPQKNIEAWEHVKTLSGFFSIYYNTKTDRLLMKFSRDILRIEWKQYFEWLLGGSCYGIKYVFSPKRFWGLFLIFIGVIKALYLLGAGRLEKKQLERWNHQVLLITVIAVSHFVVGFLLIIIMNHPFNRLFIPLSLYLLPAFSLLVLPPFWLEERSVLIGGKRDGFWNKR